MKKINFDKGKVIKVFNKTGVESTIYLYELDGKIVLLKRFKDEIKFHDRVIITSENILENKEKKIELIENKMCLKDEVKILASAYEDGKFIGYFMEFDDSYLKTVDQFLKRKNKIKILKQLRKKIEEFNSNNIFIGDMKLDNILLSSDYDIKLCDLDNFKIDNLDFDIQSVIMKHFNKRCSKTEYIDSYVFNLFTISLIENIYMPYIFDYLSSEKLPHIINTKENKDVLDSIINLDSTYERKFLIDNIRHM